MLVSRLALGTHDLLQVQSRNFRIRVKLVPPSATQFYKFNHCIAALGRLARGPSLTWQVGSESVNKRP